MSDLLSSASLLMGIIAVLYGLWYPDIRLACDIVLPQYQEQCTGPLNTVWNTIKTRALPLILISYGMVIVFVKDALQILYSSSITLLSDGFNRILNYSSVSTAFVFVEILLFIMAVQISVDFFNLIEKRRKLKAVPPLPK